jgi:hypothetical protein
MLILSSELSSGMMMEAARTSETSVDNYFTRQYISEDNSELRTRCRDNLKYHNVNVICVDIALARVRSVNACRAS